MPNSEDLPFVLKGGGDTNTALENRVSALNRVNYLVRQKIPTFDIRDKSQDYKNFLDLTLYKQYYLYEKDKPIDEEFCQRMAGLCIELDGEEEVKVDKEEFDTAAKEAVKPVNRDNWISRFFKR